MPAPPDALVDLAAPVYVKAGMRPNEARLAADTLVQAGSWGHHSHGVLRLSWYVARLQAGVCDPVAVPEPAVDAGAVAVLDGKHGIGQVVAARAAQQAVKRAKAHGIGVIGLRNSNNFGTATY
jgi:LDH2 family malate/lactate/ureidoglycolate dehydrogenase